MNRLRGILLGLVLIVAGCSGGNAPENNAAEDNAENNAAEELEPTPDSADPADDDDGRSLSGPDDEVADVVEPDPIRDTFLPLNEPGVGGRITSISFDPANPDRVFVGGDLLGIAVTDDFGQTWQSTTGLASWEIGDITATPSADGRIWTGSLSGPQSSFDGVNWSLTREGMPALSETRFSLAIETVLIDPNDNNRLLAFNGNQRNWMAPGSVSPATGTWDGDGSVWQSTDSGQTWSRISIVAPAANIRAAAFTANGSQLYAAVGNRGVFVSTDGGITWANSGTGLPHGNAYDITTHPSDPQVAWIAMGEGPQVNGSFVAGGIWKTEDGGATWNGANNGLTIVSNPTAFNTASFHQIVVAPSEPDRLFTSNVAPGQAAIYRSDDGGDSWSIIADGATSRPNAYESALRAFDIGVHPANADRIVIGSDDTLLGTVDGGDTWIDMTTTEPIPEFYSGRGYSGLVSTDIIFNPSDPEETILLGFDGGNFIQTIDGGESWRRTIQDISAWGGGVEAAYSLTNPDQIYVLLGQFQNFRGIGVSDNGGEDFSLSVGANSGLPAVGNVDGGATGLTLIDDDGTDVVFAVVGRTLYRSSDNANTFTPVAGVARARDVAADTAGNVFASADGGVFVSTDGGISFTAAGTAPAGISTLYTSATEPGIVYGIAFREGEGGAYRFDGTAWTRIFDDFFSHGIAIDPTDANNLAVVTTEPQFNDISSATGVHLSSDGGRTWTAFVDGLPMTRLRTAEFDPADPDRLVVGTTGRGFYDISFADALASR